MGHTWVTAMAHILDDEGFPAALYGPAAGLASHLGSIASAGTVAAAGEVVHTPLPCRRRPGRRPCPGRIRLRREDVPQRILWECPVCDDNGVITGWQGTPWDLTRRRSGGPVAEGDRATRAVRVNAARYRLLRALPLLDPEAQRLVFGAREESAGIRLEGNAAVFEEQLGGLAAAANAEERGARRRAHDALSESLRRRAVGPGRR